MLLSNNSWLFFICLDPPQAESVGMLRAPPLNPRKTGGGSGRCLIGQEVKSQLLDPVLFKLFVDARVYEITSGDYNWQG